jgi:itaconate CoA-transferase
MYAYSNILAALIQRGKTGRGSRVEVSMLETMAEWMSYPLYYSIDGASPPPRSGAAHATIYPYGPFTAGDGKVVMLGLQNEREWAIFCDKVLLQPELASDARYASNLKRTAARQEVKALVEQAFAGLDAAQVETRLEAAGIANARVNDMHDLWQHEQLKARGRWVEVDSPAGRLPALLPPGLPSDIEPRMDAVPALGQHTEAILAGLGYSSADIERLQGERAI